MTNLHPTKASGVPKHDCKPLLGRPLPGPINPPGVCPLCGFDGSGEAPTKVGGIERPPIEALAEYEGRRAMAGDVYDAAVISLCAYAKAFEATNERTMHEVAALLLARSNNTEDAMGEFIPQAVYDSLYERKLLTLGSDITGESWAMTTEAGDAYLREALERTE